MTRLMILPVDADSLGAFVAAGAIDYGSSGISPDYTGDMDWYGLTLGDVGGETTYHQVRMTIDNGETVNGTAPLRIVVYDADMGIVTSHDFTTGGERLSKSIQNAKWRILYCRGTGQCQAVGRSTTYQVTLEETDLNDDGGNHLTTTPLTAPSTTAQNP
jgi:hypothetical protein